MSKRVFGAFIVVVVVATMGSAPANAAPQRETIRIDVTGDGPALSGVVFDRHGRQVHNYNTRRETVNGRTFSVITFTPAPPPLGIEALSEAVACEASLAPAPTYSASNNWMHFGHKIICTTPQQLRMRSALFSGPDTTEYQWSTPTPYVYNGVGFTHYETKQRPCADPDGYTYWKLFGYHEIFYQGYWQWFTPYPGTHSPRWQQCTDLF